MQKILVPTDFSDTALNAAHYAIEFAKQFSFSKIILFNAYQAPLSVDPTTPVLQLFNLSDIKQVSSDSLSVLKNKLALEEGSEIDFEVINEFATVSGSIHDIIDRLDVDLIIMGITGGSGIDVLIGSNTISVADNAKVPVIIVPATCTYKTLKSLVWVFDDKTRMAAVSRVPVEKLLEKTRAALHLLCIDHNTGSDNKAGKLPEGFLKEYNPEFHYSHNKHFAEATNDFVESFHADMIVTVSKKHGFFENIFRKNHTKELAFHSHVPLMCVHEEG